MHRMFHKLHTVFVVGMALAVTLALMIRHPARVLANGRKRATPLAGLGSDASAVRSLLYIKMDGLGDFVLATPLLRALRSRFAGARIVVVVDQWLRESVDALGIADEVLGFDWRGGAAAAARRAARFASEKLSGPFDAAIVPRWEVDLNLASILAFLSGANLRVGFSRKVSPRKRLLNLFNDNLYSHVVVAGAELHEVEKNLLLSRLLGLGGDATGLFFRGTALPDEVAAALAPRGERPMPAPIVALGIGAMGENRRWPIASFGIVASWILAAYPSALVVLIGGASDREAASTVRDGSKDGERVLDLTGKITVGQSFETIRRATVFVGNDSGPKHLAAAAGTPIVEISSFPVTGDPTHYSAVNRYGAWAVRATILQPKTGVPPCKRACEMYEAHCIASISPERVAAALKEILDEIGGDAPVDRP